MLKTVSCQIFTLLLLLAMSSLTRAQDYVGVLPEMLNPEVSEKLGLSDQQRDQVQALIRSRMSAVIGLSQQLRETPTSQHDKMRADFNAESERLGFAILDPEQQAELAKHRVKWMGMLSLGDEKVAQSLNLADWQQETVAQWTQKVAENRRGSAASRTRSEAERAIRQEISDSQWATWQVLAGVVDSTEAGPPMPPERNVAEPNAIAFDETSSDRSSEGDESNPGESTDNSEAAIEDIRLVMNFNGTPWSDVVQWLAQQADFSVQSDVYPPGTFTYRDRSRQYSVAEAMDMMNAVLLNTGYTLFRQGRMLRVIDFEQDQEKSGELIAELADYVSEEELARRGQFEPVKHMFTLERLDPETIFEEAEQLRSIQGTVRSLPASRQLLVVDMAGNVRAIAEMIQRAENSGSSTIQMFPLKSVGAEEVLSVARPLLGLADDVNVSDDIRISTNPFGTILFASGKPDKLKNLKDLIDRMDVPPEDSESTVLTREPLVLRPHKVIGIEMQLAYEVVSQLLAGSPDVKLAQNVESKQLILSARPSEHQLVSESLATLAGEASNFVVVQLKRLDPSMAILAIKKFFGLPDTPSADSGNPVIDGDLLARQVWIKGSAAQVQQITELIEKLEANASSNDILGESIRMVPLTGRSARQTLEQVQQLWDIRNSGANPIRILTPSQTNTREGSLEQKSFAPKPATTQTKDSNGKTTAIQAAERPASRSGTPGRFTAFTVLEAQDGTDANGQIVEESASPPNLTLPQDSFESSASDDTMADGKGSAIVIMEGPNGLIIQSDDKQALAEFDSLLRLLADQAKMGGSGEPTIVYLKHRKAAAAKELLEAILSGRSSSGDSGGGLLGDMASSVLGGFGGGMFGSLLGGGGSESSSSGVGIATGDYTMTADPWLNCLVIKASPSDMYLIEQLLEVIDRPEGPLTIETQGDLKMIPVISQDANQVLTLIKQLYGERIEGNSSSGGVSNRGGGGGGSGGQPNPAELIAALRGGSSRGGRGGGAASELVEPKIAIGVDTISNTLIVRAQPNQIRELEVLVAEIDRVGEAEKEDFGYTSLQGIVSANVFKDSVGRILGPRAQTNVSQNEATSSSNSSTPSGGGSTSGGDDAAAQARRQAFFEALRARGGSAFGGGTGGGGTGAAPSGRGSTGGTSGSPFGVRGSSGFGGGRGGDSGRGRGGN